MKPARHHSRARRLARILIAAALAVPIATAVRAQSTPDDSSVTAAAARQFKWRQLRPTGSTPATRLSCLSILDPSRDRMVFFGGWGNAYFNDTWALGLDGGTSWTRLAPPGDPPAPRLEHASIYDPVRDRMVVFGGKDLDEFFNDTWALSLAGDGAWTRLLPAGTPPSPRETRAIYDPVRDRLVFTCGYGYPYHLNETWALSLGDTPTWTQLFPDGYKPHVRRGQSVIYDPLRDRLILYGGLADPTFFGDVWALWLSGTPRWERLYTALPVPEARYGHTAIYDPIRDEMLMFGGYNTNTGSPRWLDDAWVLKLSGTPRWEQVHAIGPNPDARDFQATLYDPVRDQMILFGGNQDRPLGDVWTLAMPSRGGLAPLPASGPPSDRAAGGGAAADDALRRATGATLSLAVEGVQPAHGRLDVRFSLPGREAAFIELLDVTGRRLNRVEVGSLGAGSHLLTLSGPGGLRPGVYLVRLISPAGARALRAVVLD